MSQRLVTIEPPSLGLLLTEAPRAIGEFGLYLGSRPLLRRLPRGDGHPVLIVPGMGADDFSTRPLRRVLQKRGYYTHGWRQGRNTGRFGLDERLRRRLLGAYKRHGRKVSVIGWSLGGIYARELARLEPDIVRCVITLGSPFAGTRDTTNVARVYRWLSGRNSAGSEPGRAPPARVEPERLSVPSTAIFSRGDGVVAWQTCMEKAGPTSENIAVYGSHCGLGHNPAVLYAIADRLAQAPDEWARFETPAWLRYAYPRARPSRR